MGESRTKNSIKNIASGGLNKIVLLILPFISRTVIMYILGAEYLGVGSLFMSILQILNLTELGFSSAIVFSLYKPLAQKDEATVRGLMTFYKRVYYVVGLIIFVVGICLMPFLKYLIKGTLPDEMNIYLIYIIYLVNTCVSYLAFAYKGSLLQADQKVGKANNVQSILICLQYLAQIIILIVTKNYYYYLILLPIFSLAYNLVIAAIVDKMYPQYIKQGKIDTAAKQELAKQVSGVAVSKICGVLRNSIDSITISAFVSITAVAIYGNYYYILSAVHGVMTVITVGIRASVGHSIATETNEKNFNDMLKFNYIFLLIGGWCSACMMCLYQDFMRIWVGSEFVTSDFTMLLYVIYFYTLVLGDIRNVYIEAKGLWWQYRLRSVLESVSNLVLNIVLVRLLGIPGVIVATLITYWVINFGYGTPILFKSYFGKEYLKPYIVQCGKYTLINLAVCGAMYLLCSFSSFENRYLQLGVKALLCCTVAVGMLLLAYRYDGYFKDCLLIKDKIVGRGKKME